MAYLRINRARFEFLLGFGVSDDELRRFFMDKRTPLIQKGGKVQNVPRGNGARIQAVASLPPAADPILRQWFSVNLSMLDPVPVNDVVETFHMYEEANEQLPEGDAKRLSRSSLIHLFSENPPQLLMDFLRSPMGGNAIEPDPEPEKPQMPQVLPEVAGSSLLNPALAASLVAIVDGRDPDEFVAELPPPLASFITGLHAVRENRPEEVQSAIEELENFEKSKALLADYAARYTKAMVSATPAASGIHLISLDDREQPEFDFAKDEIIGFCTRDFPENAVFVRPFAIRKENGSFFSLETPDRREDIFPISGDVMAFQGREYPKQPKKNEIGIWRVSPNPGTDRHRTNYHLAGVKKAQVYEVRSVPFKSNEPDLVRGFIKEQIARECTSLVNPLLFLLRDGLILGCPPGKDLSKDEGFEQGLPSWRALGAFRFEGRILVPAPLPESEQYECETLASSLKKFLSSKRPDSEKLTKAQLKYLQDVISTGEPHLNAMRRARLLEELRYLGESDGAVELLLEEAMKDKRITARINDLVQAAVAEQTTRKTDLTEEVAQLERRLTELKTKLAKQEKEQKALPPSLSKAIKESAVKATNDAVGTLGQVLLFKAVMDNLSETPHAEGQVRTVAPTFRITEPSATPLRESLKALGIPSKHARALEIVGDLAFSAGLFLVIEGTAARLAAEAWARTNANGSMVLECGVGVTDAPVVAGIASDEPRSVVILDANLSPIDVYARRLIDNVQRRISNPADEREHPRILMSLSASIAGLPLPRDVEAVSVRVSLESNVEFLDQEDVQARLEYMENEEADKSWASVLWKPAFKGLMTKLKSLSAEDAALAVSVLEADAHRGDRAVLN